MLSSPVYTESHPRQISIHGTPLSHLSPLLAIVSGLFCAMERRNPRILRRLRTLSIAMGVYTPGDALFARSLRSFTKECLRTPLQTRASALFFKTAGCMPSLPNLKLLHQDVPDLICRSLRTGWGISLSFASTFNRSEPFHLPPIAGVLESQWKLHDNH
jgi:hypothetical protein